MNFIKHPSNNHVFKAPKGMDNCDDLPVTVGRWNDYRCIVSFWQPTEEEKRSIAEGKPIQLTIIGSGMPPVSLVVT